MDGLFEFAVGDCLYEVSWGRRRDCYGNWLRYQELERSFPEASCVHNTGDVIALIAALRYESDDPQYSWDWHGRQ